MSSICKNVQNIPGISPSNSLDGYLFCVYCNRNFLTQLGVEKHIKSEKHLKAKADFEGLIFLN